jgi:hypothetical protein
MGETLPFGEGITGLLNILQQVCCNGTSEQLSLLRFAAIRYQSNGAIARVLKFPTAFEKYPD